MYYRTKRNWDKAISIVMTKGYDYEEAEEIVDVIWERVEYTSKIERLPNGYVTRRKNRLKLDVAVYLNEIPMKGEKQ